MGYLDVPRIHFAGLFYTGPSTINNLTTNYMPQVPLEKPDGQFNRNALWYPTGLAQIFLHNCKCLGAVDGTGGWIGSGDPLIGAPVETPSPYTPVEDGQGGVYDIAKMVDLDPDQQGRSAVFGLRFLITVPGGATFGGAAGVPELREMGPRVTLKMGSYTAVGQWMTTIDQPQWPAGTTSSPLLNAFRNACTNGIAVEMTVDLHWNVPQISQNGLMFCYGRVHGTMGPLRAGESGQILHGRPCRPSPLNPSPRRSGGKPWPPSPPPLRTRHPPACRSGTPLMQPQLPPVHRTCCMSI